MLNPLDDRNLHSANILCCIGALATDAAFAGGAATVIGATLSAKEVAKRLPKDKKALARTLRADLVKAFEQARIPEARQSIVHDMIAASVPTQDMILAAGEDPAAVLQAMKKVLRTQTSEPEYHLDNNLSHFANVVGPVLTRLLTDPAITAGLEPYRNRALWEVRAGVADLHDGQAEIKAAQTAHQAQLTDMQAMLQRIAAGQDTSAVPLDYLIDIANLFGGFEGADRAALTNFLQKKAAEYHALKSEVDAIDPGLKRLANLKTAAQDAIARVALEEVEELLEQVQTAELEEAAKTAELRAENALLRGRVDQAYALLCHAADSFPIVDEGEVARRRFEGMKLLYTHGLRYGGTGLPRAIDMLNHTSLGAARETDPDLWAKAQNNLAIALQEQGKRTEGPAGADLLAQAVAAFRDALTVCTRADHPVQWAMTQENLALAEQALAQHDSTPDPRPHLRAALAYVEAALTVYDPDHMSYHFTGATKVREQITAALADLPPA